MRNFTVTGNGGLELAGYAWEDVAEPRAIIQISHGMAEHARRYERFATYLNERGYLVVAHDHRGHGASLKSMDDMGYLGEDGWNLLVDDLFLLTSYIKARYPGLPLIIFGHSMGSFALRKYLTLHGEELAGAVISGTGNNPPALNAVAVSIARMEVYLKGPRHRSRLMDSLSFGSFNSAFKPNRTAFDWLSRDEGQVDRYCTDPLCGQIFTSSFFADFVQGLRELGRMDDLRRIPAKLPVLFVSGKEDPLSAGGKAVEAVAARMEKAGLSRPELRIYEGARHELVNETNHAEVYGDISAWISTVLAARS